MGDKAEWIKSLKKPLYDMDTKLLELVVKHKMNLSNSVATKTTNALKRYFKRCFAEGIKPKSDLDTLMRVVREEISAEKKAKVKSAILELAQSMKDKQIRDDLDDEQLKKAIREEVEFRYKEKNLRKG